MLKFDLPVKAFKTQKDWEKWLAKNHSKPDGIWLRFYKKASGVKTIVYAEALDAALCYGWIDGQSNRYDEKSYVQRFTPRRKRSVWSKTNIAHTARLKKLGRMKPAGLAAIAEAKKERPMGECVSPAEPCDTAGRFLGSPGKEKESEKVF
ncbi:MAG: bacteriocin-protection protein, YdeI/OmpD-associated family [Candidatus Doudnabacteria bacterium]